MRILCDDQDIYRQVSNISRTKSQHLRRFSYCLAAFFAESLEARCQVENADVVGAEPRGDAPTTSEWSTILLPTKVHLILEILWYLQQMSSSSNLNFAKSWVNCPPLSDEFSSGY